MAVLLAIHPLPVVDIATGVAVLICGTGGVKLA
jgi:hypothetical protein